MRRSWLGLGLVGIVLVSVAWGAHRERRTDAPSDGAARQAADHADTATRSSAGAAVAHRAEHTAVDEASDAARLRAATVAAQQQEARDDVRFHARPSRGELAATNPAQHFRIRYRAESTDVVVDDHGGRVGIATRGIGCGDSLSTIEPSAPSVSPDDARRVEYQRSGTVNAREWFLNGVAGLEQGYEVASAACGDRPLVFEVELSGLDARDERGRIALADPSGRDRLAYGELFATDADGTMLPSRLSLVGARARLEVDVRGARFPVSVDPLVVTQEQILQPDSPGLGTQGALLGSSVSISGDTAVVNSPSDLYGGSAYIFVRSGTTWSLQQRITNPDYNPADFVFHGGFASAVAVSGDTLVVGYADFQDDGTDTWSGAGQVLVYVRTGTSWALQGSLVRGSGQGQGAAQGYGLSIAIDGNTVVAGAQGETTGLPAAGAVYIFTRSGTMWSLNARTLATAPTGSARFGADVAIQGSRIVIGEPGRSVGGNGAQGVAYLWEYTTGWNQTATLQASDGATSDQFGTSVDVDGTSILVGAPYANVGAAADAGAGYVFVDGGPTVTQQAKLVGGAGVAALDMMGGDVAIVGDVAMLGAPGWAVAGVDSGAGLVFTRSGSTWSFAGARIGSNSHNYDFIGRSVAMDGTSALVGAPNWDEVGRLDQGEAIVFATAGLPFQAYLMSGRSASQDHFATSVDVSGTTVVVGAPYDASLGVYDAGCVYVFLRGVGGTYTLQAKLTAPAPVASDSFGYAVALDGNLLAVGVPKREVSAGAGRTGAVMMYRRTGTSWALENSLVTSAPQVGASLGRSVALHGNHLVAGEPDFDTGTTAYNLGRVAFFEQSTPGVWSNVNTITPPLAVGGDYTGATVAVHGSLAVVGATYAKVGTTMYQGAVYAYRWNGTGWTEQTPRLTLTGAQSYGSAITVFGPTVAVGLPTANSGRGLVHVYTDTGGVFGAPMTITPPAASPTENFGNAVDFDGSVLSVTSLPRLRTYYFDGSTFNEQTAINAPASFSASASYGTKVASAPGIVVVSAPDHSDGNTPLEGRAVAYSVTGLRGQGCMNNAECGSGFCVDNVCCNTACGGSPTDCQACSVAAGASTNGTCEPIAAAAMVSCRPADASGCDVAELCNGVATTCPADTKVGNGMPCNGAPSGICDAQDTCLGGACQLNYAPSSTTCSAASCSGGSAVPASQCTGTTTTCPLVMASSCPPYACGPTACKTSCTVDAECDAAYYCSGANTCVAKLAQGQFCAAANQCLSGMCGGVCGGMVDECALNTDNCDANATCSDLLMGFTCACNSGFTGNGFTCTDINECASGNGGCAVAASCTNTPGSRTCTCNAGYVGTGITCNDVDECATSNGTCSTAPMVTCTNSPGSYACAACPSGYAGDGHTCSDVDECATNNGGCSTTPMVTCTNTPGSRTCGGCPAGYAGSGVTCVDVDECALNTDNCSISATCTNVPGTFSCTCNGGYTGNGQTCSDVNECATNNGGCSVNATCTNTQGTFTCSCNTGYSGAGITCTDVNECATSNGGCSTSPMVACTNTAGSRTCAPCPTGYTGDGQTCTDVNECTLGTDTCTSTQACTNSTGSFSCTSCDTNATVTPVGGVEACVCNSGYGGNGQSCTANACTPACGIAAVCGASFTCACPAGYGGDPLTTCTDLDECTLNTDTCSANANCTNTVGWFTCACMTGFTGDGVTCTDVDECSLGTDTCAADAYCTDTSGSYLCTCNVGYQGDGRSCVLFGTDAGIGTDAGGLTDAGSDSGSDAGTITIPDGGGDGSVPPHVRDEPSTGLCATAVGSNARSRPFVLGTMLALVTALVLRRRRRSGVVFAVLVLVATAFSMTPSAGAQTTDESVARAQFQLGQAYLNEARFHEAAVAFESAYAASSRAGLLYNAFVAYRDAQELENAANALRRFLAADPTSDTPLLRGRLEAIETQIAAQHTASEASERERQAAADAAASSAETATTTAPPPETTPLAEAASHSNRGLAFGLIGGGAGLAAIGMLGGGLGAGAQHDRLTPYCGASAGLAAGQCLDVQTVGDVESKTRLFRAVAWGSLGLGVSVAAVGTVMLLTGGDDEGSPAVVALPTCTVGGCSVTVLGRF